MAKIDSYRALKGERNYGIMVLANFVNRFGDSIDAIAFSWMMYEVSGSASFMALILGLNFLPTVLLQPFAGVLVDRMRKKPVMVATDVGRGIAVLATVLLYRAGSLSPALLIAITLVNSTLESLRSPAGSAIVPKILPEEKYTVGLALMSTLSRVTELVGLAIAGSVIAVLGVTGALLIDMGTFLFSAAALSFLKINEKSASLSGAIRGLFPGFREGMQVITKSKVLLALVGCGMMINLGVVPINAFETPYVVDHLHGGPALLSVIQIVLVAGMGLGAFLTPKLRRIPGYILLSASGMVMALSMGALAWIPGIAREIPRMGALMLMAFLMGAGVGIMNVLFSAAFMRLVPEEKLGVVSGINTSVVCACMPVGSFACSAIAGQVSVLTTLAIAAGFCLIVYAGMLFVKPLREI